MYSETYFSQYAVGTIRKEAIFDLDAITQRSHFIQNRTKVYQFDSKPRKLKVGPLKAIAFNDPTFSVLVRTQIYRSQQISLLF